MAFKTLYAWGLRRNELVHLVHADFSRNARAPQFGSHGVLRVRFGKAMRGSPPKPRTVLTVFDWSAEMMDNWVRVGLPRFNGPRWSPLFPSSTGTLIDGDGLLKRLHGFVDERGFPPGLDLHSFRRAYATNLQIESGYDVTFVQLQLGHEHASTTSVYAIASPDYRTRELDRVLTSTVMRSQATFPDPKGHRP